MASNNFLVFDENKQNMLSDTAYDADSQRKNGLEPGMARSALMNKVLYQITSVCSSIAQFLASKGYDIEESADSLYDCINDLLSSKIVDDTTSLNEGIYRNLLLNANISDDINNLALGKKTLYDFTHGLGYMFIYQANITNEDDVNALRICDNRYQLANNKTALGVMAKYDTLAKQWRSNEFLSLGKRKKVETVVCNNITANFTDSSKVIKIPNTSKMLIAPTDKTYLPLYSVDSGKTWANMTNYGIPFFSSDYKYWYIKYDERSDRGVTWYSGEVSDFATRKNTGNVTVKYGELQYTTEFLIFETEGVYWMFTHWVGETYYSWAEAYVLSNPLNLNSTGSANFHSGIGSDNWHSIYKVGKCILAIWIGKTASNSSTGEYDVGLLLIKGNQIVKKINDSVDYTSYGNNAGVNLSVQFGMPDATDTCHVRVNIYSGGDEEIRKYYAVDGNAAIITEVTSSALPYSISWSTAYTYQLPSNTQYKCIIDSQGNVVNDNMDYGFNFPSPLQATNVKAVEVKGDIATYVSLQQYIDSNTNKFTQYYMKNKQFIKVEQYLDDDANR